MAALHTSDLSDGFFLSLVRVCDQIGACHEDLLCVMHSESGIRPSAHNVNGDASGLIQFMPSTLKGLGWTAGDEAFRRLSAEAQLPFVRRYFAPHKGKLGSETALYLCTFLPALLDHADEPGFVLAMKGGIRGWAYLPNVGFDKAKRGAILVSDLTDALERQKTALRYQEAVARAREAQDALTTSPAA